MGLGDLWSIMLRSKEGYGAMGWHGVGRITSKPRALPPQVSCDPRAYAQYYRSDGVIKIALLHVYGFDADVLPGHSHLSVHMSARAGCLFVHSQTFGQSA